MKVSDNKIYAYIDNNNLLMEQIIADYSNYINTIIRKSYINLSNEDMEEILLDVFFTIWKNQDKLDKTKSMSAYISGITKNLIKYKYRQNKENQCIEEYEDKLTDSFDIDSFVSHNESERIILKELEKLKKDDKEIFIEYYYENQDIKNIAKMFNMSDTKIKSKLFRTRKKLRKALKKGGYSSNGQ